MEGGIEEIGGAWAGPGCQNCCRCHQTPLTRERQLNTAPPGQLNYVHHPGPAYGPPKFQELHHLSQAQAQNRTLQKFLEERNLEIKYWNNRISKSDPHKFDKTKNFDLISQKYKEQVLPEIKEIFEPLLKLQDNLSNSIKMESQLLANEIEKKNFLVEK